MGVATTITIGVDTFDVYAFTALVALADADSYFVGRFGTTAWDAATDDNKSKALVSAARWLDRLNWAGTPTDVATPQNMAWPRTGVPNCDGIAVSSSEVPDRIVEAQFELAQFILDDSTSQEQDNTGSNLKRVKAEGAEVEFFRPTIFTSAAKKLPQPAWDLVKCFIGSGSLGAPYVKGAGTINGTPTLFGPPNSNFNEPGLA